MKHKDKMKIKYQIYTNNFFLNSICNYDVQIIMSNLFSASQKFNTIL